MSAAAADPRARVPHQPIPPGGTVERWCFDLVAGTALAHKCAPDEPPLAWEPDPPVRRFAAPGRPRELAVVARSPSAPRPGALVRPAERARLLHTFVHHELQAAELFAWAVLAFPRTPADFRAGLLRLCREELLHLGLYLAHMRALGGEFGAHPVRDWFWTRVPLATDAAAFVALQGLGLEGANLDHCPRFAAAFRAAGDEAGARILERVQQDEIGHVAFAARWFAELTGAPLTYDAWRAALPPPLTPALLRGRPLAGEARRRAGLDEAFLARLEAEPPVDPRRRA